MKRNDSLSNNIGRSAKEANDKAKAQEAIAGIVAQAQAFVGNNTLEHLEEEFKLYQDDGNLDQAFIAGMRLSFAKKFDTLYKHTNGTPTKYKVMWVPQWTPIAIVISALIVGALLRAFIH